MAEFQIIQRSDRSDVGGGSNSAANYDLYCGECRECLGPLGVFHERAVTEAARAQLLKLDVDAAVGSMIRVAHCGHCHATSVVGADRTNVCPATNIGALCAVCGRPPRDKRPLSAAS